MNNWSDYETFLKPVHLKGQAVTLTIVKASEEETHPQRGKTVTSPVLWFKELPFGLILSPTNRATLIALYGDAIAGCLGKPITVQAVAMKVAGNDKQPIRILKQRPAAAHVDTATGEIVQSAAPAVVQPAAPAVASPAVSGVVEMLPATPPEDPAPPAPPASELDAFLGHRPTVPDPFGPSTEAEFIAYLKARGITGQETHRALGIDPKTWLKQNPGQTWRDVALTVSASLGK